MDVLRKATQRILNQLSDLASTLSDEEYRADLPVLLNNSIGRHFRHILEFYGIMLEGFSCGELNYDLRKHDPELEKDRKKALGLLRQIRSRIDDPAGQEALTLAGDYSTDNTGSFTLSTTRNRELLYNIEHAVHHMAIIRIAILHEYPEVPLPRDFGYAISTLKHHKEN